MIKSETDTDTVLDVVMDIISLFGCFMNLILGAIHSYQHNFTDANIYFIFAFVMLIIGYVSDIRKYMKQQKEITEKTLEWIKEHESNGEN